VPAIVAPPRQHCRSKVEKKLENDNARDAMQGIAGAASTSVRWRDRALDYAPLAVTLTPRCIYN
jgi:hypothetical protein